MRGSELNCTPGKGVGGGGDEIFPEFFSRALLSKRQELASFLFTWIA